MITSIVSLNRSFFCKRTECFFATPKCRFPNSNEANEELVHRILNDIFREKAACFGGRRHDYVKVRCLYAIKHNFLSEGRCPWRDV